MYMLTGNLRDNLVYLGTDQGTILKLPLTKGSVRMCGAFVWYVLGYGGYSFEKDNKLHNYTHDKEMCKYGSHY
jgi:hypothetical protein